MSAQDLWNEDLAWQAQRGFELGNTLCACDGFYHALWGSLRLAGLNNTMKGEAPILASLLAPYLRDNARVMIGGSADPGVLCGIGRIYSPHMPAFTVIDKCRAPLALIREFAAARGLACRSLKRDLLELDGSETWDQIVLHYTPDFIEPRLRGPLFRSLAASLAPGGILVCAAMTGASIPFEKRPEMEAAFFTRAIAALKETPMADLARTPAFEQQLHSYTAGRTLRRLTLPTTDDICEFLHDSGLQVVDKHATSRARRLLVGMEVVDTSSIIIASAG
jgi:hypothetical protein